MIRNDMHVDKIVYRDNLRCYCPLGKSFYTNKLLITIIPNKHIPDYIKLHEEILSLVDKVFIIEEAVASVLDIVAKCNPLKATVTSYVSDASHPPVVITKHFNGSEEYNE